MTTASTAALAAELTLLTCDQPLTVEILGRVQDGLRTLELTSQRPAVRTLSVGYAARGSRVIRLPVRSR